MTSQAFIHRSYCNEHPGLASNERLEFLGDAVLSLIISERLYKLFPQEPEGKLTARRSSLVQTSTLAKKAIQLGLNKQVLLSHGEEEWGGRTNPSLLADTFEAVLGEKYLEQGLAACESYLQEIFPDAELMAETIIKDPKSDLQERVQAAKLGTPNYEVISAVGPDHAKTFTVQVRIGKQIAGVGEGNSKQRAETAAATAALAKFPLG